jgi:DNA-binding response OmpR family regulator
LETAWRNRAGGPDIYRFGDCELDDQRYELRRGGALVHLEPQVFEVLASLAATGTGSFPRPSCWTRSGTAAS